MNLHEREQPRTPSRIGVVSRECEKFLNHHQVPELTSENLQTFFIETGSELVPFKASLIPALLELWGSALSRPQNDKLVVEDASKYPFSEKNSVYITQDCEDKLAAIYLHRKIEYCHATGLAIGICLVDENFQRKNITRQLISHSIKRIRPGFFSFHTQNEHMVQTARAFCPKGRLFPIDETPELVIEMGREFAHHKDQYDHPLMIERGFYQEGNPLYGDRRERHSSHPDIRKFFDRNVNFQNGDALLVVGLFPHTDK